MANGSTRGVDANSLVVEIAAGLDTEVIANAHGARAGRAARNLLEQAHWAPIYAARMNAAFIGAA